MGRRRIARLQARLEAAAMGADPPTCKGTDMSYLSIRFEHGCGHEHGREHARAAARTAVRARSSSLREEVDAADVERHSFVSK